MADVKLGFVGCGFMGQLAHLPNFLAVPECQVVALAEKRPKLARLVAEKHHIPKVYESHSELAAGDEVQAVAAILPEGLNDQVACDLLRAGKHVFLEKPMARSVEAARRMVAAAEAGGALLMIGYMKRYDPGVEKAREILTDLQDSGQLGAITFARSHCFGGDWICGLSGAIATDEPYPAVQHTPPPAWLPEDRHADFHRFNNVYCHNVNLLRWLLGTDLTVGHAYVEGSGAWLVRFSAGSVPVSLEVGGLAAHVWEEHTIVYFEKGWLLVETPPPLLRNVGAKVTLYRGADMRETWQPLPEWTWGFYNEAAHFVECVAQGKTPHSSGHDSLRDMEIAEEVFRHALGGH